MKTIFFSFSVQTVYKNFFFFKGSVYDKIQNYLLTHDDIQFIFVAPKTYGVFDPFSLDHLERPAHPRCVTERVVFPKDPTFWQKILRFFYSYFIYTGTTRIMATIGIRPDEPPAGGRFKKLLAPLKIGIASTLGRSRWMRDRVVPFFYYKFFSERPFAKLFDQYAPDLVFVPHLYGSFDTALLAEAKRRGVESLGMVSNWDHFDKYFLPLKADTILAQSDQIKRFAIEYQGYRAKDITVVGYPHFDFLINEQKESRAMILDEFGFPPGSRYLLYISGSAYCRDEPEIIQEVLRWIDQGKFGENIFLIVRPYAGARPADREYDKEKFARFSEHPHARVIMGEFWGDAKKVAVS